MVDIDTYRSRIGRFYQQFRMKKLKLMKYENVNQRDSNSGKLVLMTLQIVLKSALLLAFVSLNSPEASHSVYCPPYIVPIDLQVHHSLSLVEAPHVTEGQAFLVLGRKQHSNFKARYIFGNLQVRGRGITSGICLTESDLQ